MNSGRYEPQARPPGCYEIVLDQSVDYAPADLMSHRIHEMEMIGGDLIKRAAAASKTAGNCHPAAPAQQSKVREPE